MPNAMLEKSGSDSGDGEVEQHLGCVALEGEDGRGGSPEHSSSASDVENYDTPLAGTMLNDEAPSGGSRQGNIEVSSFKEHDYIGLSDAGSSCPHEDKIKGKDLDFGPKTKETELRLGPPPEVSSTRAFQNGLQKSNTNPGPVKKLTVEQPPVKASADGGGMNSAILPVDSEGGRAGRPYTLNDRLQRWNRQCFGEAHVSKIFYPQSPLISSKEAPETKFFNNGHEILPQAQEYSNGRAYLLTPKNTSTAGAKRVFSDAIGGVQAVRNAFVDARNISTDSRVSLLVPTPSTTTSVKTDMDSKVSSQAQVQAQAQAQPVMYPWVNTIQVPNTWQINLDQQPRGGFGQFPPTARVMVGGMMAGSISINEAPHGSSSESRGKPAQESLSGMRPPMAPTAPSEQQQRNLRVNETVPNENGTSAASKSAPVVGWPPIRSFRKNLAPQPKPDTEVQTNAAGISSASADPGQPFGDSMFVKVNMDGVPIGRKIDLKAFDSYDRLSLALEEMFKRFINAQGNGQRLPINASTENEHGSLFSGTDYVLTYEDNEGDRMLVGDVPWEMFVSTVKRLRIMKSSEARILAPRQATKPQGQVTQ